jgi:hypothetical protein
MKTESVQNKARKKLEREAFERFKNRLETLGYNVGFSEAEAANAVIKSITELWGERREHERKIEAVPVLWE